MSILEALNSIDKTAFYSGNIFHERQMNSCPIGCKGCAVSASSTARGSVAFSDLSDFYEDAARHGAQLKITKVEGYDPAFVTYADDASVPFSASIKTLVELGHQVITPVCTTGSWKAQRTKWQIEELGKLPNPYRYYRYPSGNEGLGFVLSVPREINPYAAKYDFDEHLAKITEDIKLLTANGNLEALIYYNDQIDDDYDLALKLKANLVLKLTEKQLERTKFSVTKFNSDTLPESCFRYANSILVSNQGFHKINEKTLEWNLEPFVVSTETTTVKTKLVNV